MGLLEPGRSVVTADRMALDGIDLLALDEGGWRALRGGRMAMVFQEPMTSLNPVFTIGEQIAEALRVHTGLPRQAARSRALEALREGIRDLGEAMAQDNRQEGEAQGGRQANRDDPAGRDPLGRQQGNSLRIGSDDNLLSDEDVYRRAEELLDEIRRRSGDLNRPEGERDYLKRLLESF
jgi:ABC-type dipeptide/oligopeptide/nickel transport system ATPase component